MDIGSGPKEKLKKTKERIYTEGAQNTKGTEKKKLEIERAGVGDAGFAGVAAFDAADAKEFFPAALQVGFDGFYVSGGHDQDHADAHIEGLQ